MKIVQVAEMISQGGRSGKVDSSDGSLSATFTPPKADHTGGLTPELLFAGAYAACFHGAILAMAAKAHFKIEGSTVVAKVSLVENERGEWNLKVDLRASLPGVSRSDGEHLIHQAHTNCPYSKAVRGNIEVTVGTD